MRRRQRAGREMGRIGMGLLGRVEECWHVERDGAVDHHVEGGYAKVNKLKLEPPPCLRHPSAP